MGPWARNKKSKYGAPWSCTICRVRYSWLLLAPLVAFCQKSASYQYSAVTYFIQLSHIKRLFAHTALMGWHFWWNCEAELEFFKYSSDAFPDGFSGISDLLQTLQYSIAVSLRPTTCTSVQLSMNCKAPTDAVQSVQLIYDRQLQQRDSSHNPQKARQSPKERRLTAFNSCNGYCSCLKVSLLTVNLRRWNTDINSPCSELRQRA